MDFIFVFFFNSGFLFEILFVQVALARGDI
jgi:hypothetical protein